MKRIVILFFILTLIGCTKEQSTTGPIIPEQFEGLWSSFSNVGTLSISVKQKGDSLSGMFTLVYASSVILTGNVSGINQYPNISLSFTQSGSVKATYTGKFLESRVVGGYFTGYTYENTFLVLQKRIY